MFHSDASASLLVDGELVFAVAEERLNRIKHFGGVPELAIRACLDHVGADISDVDHVAVGRDPAANLNRKLLYGLRHPRTLANLTRMRLEGVRRFTDLKDMLSQTLDVAPEKLRFTQHNVEHHIAHIASAFYCSDLDRAAGFSYDGSGDWVTCMWADCRDNEIDVRHRTFVPHSLGTFYTMVSQFIGYTEYGDEGKVMGLAALGSGALNEEIGRIVAPIADDLRLDLSYFRSVGTTRGIELQPDGKVWQPPLYSDKMQAEFGAPRQRHSEIEQRDMDLAFAMQRRFEEVTFDQLRKLHSQMPSDALALAGGCALNSVVNGRIAAETPFTKTFIQPAAGDEGLSAGAALYCYHSILGRPRSYKMRDAYLGPGYSSAEIAGELDRNGITHERLEEDALVDRVSARLAEGAIVGWFQGRTEWGPRALGNRSILTHPGLEGMKDTLNSRIKHREWFRPFAPSVLAEDLTEWFDAFEPSPFMLHAFDAKPDKRERISAVVHVDGTGRVQSVTRDENPLYHRLIETFRAKTGIPMVLNTSFNENEPIVCAPAEALDCFLRTRMDVLVLGDHVVDRPGGGEAEGAARRLS